MARIWQSRPDSGLGFQVKVLTTFRLSPVRSVAERQQRPAREASARSPPVAPATPHLKPDSSEPPSCRISKEKSLNLRRSGNEVYCTNAVLLLMKIMLCSKLRCQKVLDRIFFPIRSACGAGTALGQDRLILANRPRAGAAHLTAPPSPLNLKHQAPNTQNQPLHTNH